jgi:RNA polymerase sigma-70 factor (ECF subfamily)
MVNIDDTNLIKLYLKGDEKSLEILVKRYLKPVYGFVYRYVGAYKEAEDITQETFIRAWKNLKKFESQSNFKAWLFSIAKNASIDFLRKKKAIPFSAFSARGGSAFGGENDFTETLVDPAPLPDVLASHANLKQEVALAIEKLPFNYRAVLLLRYDDRMNFREIADILGEPLNTVKSRHWRALISLKKLLYQG